MSSAALEPGVALLRERGDTLGRHLAGAVAQLVLLSGPREVHGRHCVIYGSGVTSRYGAIARDLRTARGWRDRLGYVFGPPAWTPPVTASVEREVVAAAPR